MSDKIYRPNAIEARIFLYKDGYVNVCLKSPNLSLLMEIENNLLRMYDGLTEYQRDNLATYLTRLLAKHPAPVRYGPEDKPDHKAITEMLEHVNMTLGCTHWTGSVELLDERADRPKYLQMAQTLENMAHGIKEDCWAEHYKLITGGSRGIDKSTIARAESACDHAIELVKRLRDYKANLEPTGSLLDEEV